MAVLKYYNTATSAWEYIAASTTANFTTWKKTATGGETSVSGTDDNAVTLSYTAGLEQVFINGVLQVRGSDYTATTGTSVTGLSALVASDIVTVVCYAPFNIANTIAPSLVDAKGDLLAGTAADTVGRLAVGTNNQLLTADSSTSTGLKWANGGLTLIKTESFTTSSAVNVNDVFSSTYDTYSIISTLTGSTTNAYLQLRLRVSGTDASGSDYVWGFIATNSGGTSFTLASGASATTGNITRPSTTDSTVSINIANPFLTKKTIWSGTTSYNDGATVAPAVAVGGAHSLTTSYTGFSLIPASGTITGSVSVYGYNK